MLTRPPSSKAYSRRMNATSWMTQATESCTSGKVLKTGTGFLLRSVPILGAFVLLRTAIRLILVVSTNIFVMSIFFICPCLKGPGAKLEERVKAIEKAESFIIDHNYNRNTNVSLQITEKGKKKLQFSFNAPPIFPRLCDLRSPATRW